MAGSLAGRVAIITGASRGLGRVMAIALAAEGVKVIATAGRPSADLDSLAAVHPGLIHPRVSDASDEAACQALVAEAQSTFGCLDIVVSNAGLGMIHVKPDYRTAPVRFWETTSEQWERAVALNLLGPFYLAAAAVPGMIRSGWGRIVNVGTGHGTMVRAHYSPYGPSKAGLEAATVIWAKDLAGTGVTVNALLPGGATDTALMPPDLRNQPDNGLLNPSIMAAPITWLASRDADGFTGMRIVARRWPQGLEAAATDAGWGPGGQPPGSDAST